MWTHFQCPDNETILIEDCLSSCRMGARCMMKATLTMFAKGRREWKGKISATQALNGTRIEYLKITNGYSEKPWTRAFALLGTFHHLRYQKMNIPNALQEEWMEDEAGTGMFDFYDDEEKTLYDTKTTGCYKINKALGKKKFEHDEPTGEFYKVGPKKGQEKTRKVVEWGMGEPDLWEWQMQLSRYAWMLRDAGFEVERAMIQATARDFNSQSARQYGLDRQIYLVPVEILPREIVIPFYIDKQTALLDALATGTLPPPCSPKERWADEGVTDDTTPGRRCPGFCPVWSWCELGINAHQMALPQAPAEKEVENGAP